MLLEQIRPVFTFMQPSEQQQFFETYHARRQADLDSHTIKTAAKKEKSPGQPKQKMISVTTQQLELLRKLGLV